MEADEVSVKNVKHVLRCFETFSGLSINFNKSCLVRFNVEEEFMFKMVSLCKCKIGSLPFDYLRIPLGADPRKLATWKPIVEKFKKLSGWKSQSLSFAGRVTLINAILSSLPIYYMSIFKAPKMITK